MKDEEVCCPRELEHRAVPEAGSGAPERGNQRRAEHDDDGCRRGEPDLAAQAQYLGACLYGEHRPYASQEEWKEEDRSGGTENQRGEYEQAEPDGLA